MENKIEDKMEVNTIILYLVFIALSHYIYTRLTIQKIKITIKSKYIFYDRMYKLMISSTDGKIYNVGNNLWYMHFTSSEMWESLKEGKTYNLTTFGRRIPILDMYPVIYQINQ